MERYRVKVIGTGAYLPGDPVKFDDVQHVLGEITDAPPAILKWIKQVEPVMKEILGIESYHYALDPDTRQFSDTNVSMSVKAARKAMGASGVTADDIDFIAYASNCFEHMPTTTVRIQEELGIKHCGEMSIHSNCTSVYKAIMLAHDLISLGRYKTVMVLSSHMASSQLRAEYYNQKLVTRDQLFLRWFLCDGAGAMIFTRDESEILRGNYIEASYIESVGCGKEPIMYDRRETYYMSPKEVYEKGLHHLVQRKATVLEDNDNMLVAIFGDGLDRMARLFNIDLTKTTHFQINFPAKHVFDLMKDRCCSMGVPEWAYYTKMRDYGYPGPPAVLISMDCLFREGLKSGDQVISFVTEVSKIMQAGFVIRSY